MPEDKSTQQGKADRKGSELDQRVLDLNQRIDRLGTLIEDCTVDNLETLSIFDYAKLVALYGQLCSRLGRLMRDRAQLTTGERDEIQQAIQEALGLASKKLGVDL